MSMVCSKWPSRVDQVGFVQGHDFVPVCVLFNFRQLRLDSLNLLPLYTIVLCFALNWLVQNQQCSVKWWSPRSSAESAFLKFTCPTHIVHTSHLSTFSLQKMQKLVGFQHFNRHLATLNLQHFSLMLKTVRHVDGIDWVWSSLISASGNKIQ